MENIAAVLVMVILWRAGWIVIDYGVRKYASEIRLPRIYYWLRWTGLGTSAPSSKHTL